MWCLANPKLDERDVMDALLEVDDHLVVVEGQALMADKGFADDTFEQFLDGRGVRLVRPARKNVAKDAPPKRRGRRLLRMRQIEAIDTLDSSPWNSTAPANRTPSSPGSVKRLLATATAIWFNTNTGVTSKRSLIAHDH